MGKATPSGVIDQDHHLNRHRPLDLVLVARQCHGNLGCERDRIGAFARSFGLLKQRYLDASNIDDVTKALKALQASCTMVGAHEVVRLCVLHLKQIDKGQGLLSEDTQDLKFALEDVSAFLQQISS